MRFPARVLLGLLGLIALPAAAATDSYDFTIVCNGMPVGRHSVQIVSDEDGGAEVTVDIALDVTLAGLTLYRYRHSSHETWQHGRLVALRSDTDDDGEALHVTVRSAADGQLLIEGQKGDRPLPPDVIPTSYWNPELVNRHTLLDSQSGRLLNVAVTPLLDGRYQVSGDLRLQIDYRQGRWSGLHFSYFGADIDYQPRPATQLSITLPVGEKKQ
jgi:hypothetical protein